MILLPQPLQAVIMGMHNLTDFSQEYGLSPDLGKKKQLKYYPFMLIFLILTILDNFKTMDY